MFLPLICRMSVQANHHSIYVHAPKDPINDNCHSRYYKQQPVYSSVRPSKPPRKKLNRNASELEEYAKRYKDIHSKRSSSCSGGSSSSNYYCTLPKQVVKISRAESIREEAQLRNCRNHNCRNNYNAGYNNNNANNANVYSTMSLPRRMPPVKKLVSAFNNQIESNINAPMMNSNAKASSCTLQRNRQSTDVVNVNGECRQAIWEVDRRSAEKIIELWRRQIEVCCTTVFLLLCTQYYVLDICLGSQDGKMLCKPKGTSNVSSKVS